MNGAKRTTSLSSLSQGKATFPAYLFIASHQSIFFLFLRLFRQRLITPTTPTNNINSGMAPLIRAVLSNLIGQEAAEEIEIIANDVVVHPSGKWNIQYRHPSRYVSGVPIWPFQLSRPCPVQIHYHLLFAGYAWMHYPLGKEVHREGLRSVGKYFPMEALLSKPFHIINAVDNDKTNVCTNNSPQRIWAR